ncbi:MAG: hypothetical protein NVV62_07685 [Terricaulis sp.]|nr:hypothetical protein [Terricaulis sp.]
MQYWQGLIGVAVILAMAVLLSTNRRAIRLRVVLAALAVQAALAALVLYLPAGRAALSAMSGGVQALIDFSGAGIAMVFGPLASEVGFSFAINVLPIIIFFSALMSVLYHIGLMQPVVTWVGGALRLLLGTGRVESLTAAANIFVGQTEGAAGGAPVSAACERPAAVCDHDGGHGLRRRQRAGRVRADGDRHQLPAGRQLHGRAGRAADGEDHHAGCKAPAQSGRGGR